MNKLLSLLTLGFVSALLMVTTSDVRAEIDAGTVVCGDTQSCNLSTHVCYYCTYTQTNSAPMAGSVTTTNTYTYYKCLAKGEKKPSYPTHCDIAPNGGQGTTSDGLMIGSTSSQKQCLTSNFKEKYKSCYPCQIIKVLFSAFLTAASAAYDVTKQAANVILIVAFVIWVAGFAMKNVSSFTTVEPMKMLQDLFVQLFKIILAFVIINSGLQTILHYSLVPIMNAGTDFADAILGTVADYTPEAFSYSDMPSAAKGGGGATSPTGGIGYSGGGSGGGAR